jgi:nitrite reductase/ring-hydroxylating ferredoxin subunit/uncharacterized membrane protein
MMVEVDMEIDRLVEVVGTQSWIDTPARSLQSLVRGVFARLGPTGRDVQNALYGTWLGHPLHPALTDVPVGAWTAGTVFDVLNLASPGKPFARCADASVALGVLGGLGAAAAGFNDWQHTMGQPRRTGAVHAVLNVSAVLLQATSLALRLAGRRGAGQALSALAYGGVIASSYLGSDMIQSKLVGTDHTASQPQPAEFVAVLADADLPEGQMRQVDADGIPVLLVCQEGEIYAMHATCTHMGGPLPKGQLLGDRVKCPLHGSEFALNDGSVRMGPASFPERCLSTRIRDGQIEVGPSAGLGECTRQRVYEQVAQPQAMM